MDVNNLAQLFTSKKFWVAIVGLAVSLGFLEAGDEAQVAEAFTTVAVTVSYVIGQGMADFGKSRSK